MIDQKETCAKCMDGEIEPRHCEYYGEPNGCNSPTYGEYPPVGNAAAMREALDAALRFIGNLEIEPYSPLDEDASELRQRIMDALSAPPRNCDVMSVESAKKLWFVKEIIPRLDGELPLGKEIPFEEWFVSQQEQGECDGR